MAASQMTTEGALRVEAIEKKRFEVTDFLFLTAIRREPKSIYLVFPAPVCQKIEAKLGTQI